MKELNVADLKKQVEQKMQKSLEALKHDLAKVRTGRAHAGLLDHIHIDYYGQQMPLKQVANISLADVRGPLFAILKELAEAEPAPAPPDAETPPKRIRALFLVPVSRAKDLQPILEREGLPYSLKPYHLHDFLEKVSELLVEAGAIAEPIRSIGGFGAGKRRRRNPHFSRDSRRGTMFATREDYQMTDEEMADYEREEEEGRKKREKELHDMKDRGGRA